MTDQIKVRISGEDAGVTTLLRTLSKQLGDVQKQQKAVNAETSRGDAAQRSFGSGVSSVISNLRGLAAAYGVVRAATFVKDQIDAADALSKLAQKSGITTETLSALAFAGETADVSIDQLGTSAKKFAQSSAEIGKGSSAAADAFRALGISAAAFKDLSPDQQFLKTLKTLGSYRDGLEKSKVAQDIFGRSGEELIPLANQIAEQGFGTIADAAAKAGRSISTEAGKAAEDFNDKLRLLEGQAKGAALAFGQELVPALTDVVVALNTVGETGRESFAKTFGQQVAKTIRDTSNEAIALTRSIGAELKEMAKIGVESWTAVKAAAKGDFGEAKLHFANANQAFQDLQTAGVRGFREARDAIDKAEKDADAKTTTARKGREDTEKRRLLLVDSKTAQELAKARLDAEDNARKSEGQVLAASLALRDQQVEEAFKHGLSSLDAYFKARRETIVAAGKQEVEALEASKKALQQQPVLTAVDKVKRDDSVAQKDAAIRVAQLNTTQKLEALDAQRGQTVIDLARTVAEAEAKMQEARGRTSASARVSLDQDVKNYRDAIAQMGKLSAEQQQAKVTTFQTTLTLKIDAQDAQEQVNQIFGEIDRKRTALDQEVSLGLRSQVSAQQELTQFEAGRLPTLTKLADEMERFALALDNPELLAQAQDLQVRLKAIGQTATESARLAAEMGSDIRDALKGDLSNFLGSTITQVGSLGEAFASLATSVVSSIQRIVAQLIAAKAVEGIAKLLGGIGGAPSGPKIDFAGIANTLAASGFASGGYTGKGGKYQPAGIVHKDEFVFPKEATRKIGVARLYGLMRNPRPVASWNEVQPATVTRQVRRMVGVRGYADGGLVTEGAGVAAPMSVSLGGSMDLHVTHEGVAVHPKVWLESPDGQRTLLKVTTENRGRLRGILG